MRHWFRPQASVEPTGLVAPQKSRPVPCGRHAAWWKKMDSRSSKNLTRYMYMCNEICSNASLETHGQSRFSYLEARTTMGFQLWLECNNSEVQKYIDLKIHAPQFCAVNWHIFYKSKTNQFV